jgi:hypothetical protein
MSQLNQYINEYSDSLNAISGVLERAMATSPPIGHHWGIPFKYDDKYNATFIASLFGVIKPTACLPGYHHSYMVLGWLERSVWTEAQVHPLKGALVLQAVYLDPLHSIRLAFFNQAFTREKIILLAEYYLEWGDSYTDQSNR